MRTLVAAAVFPEKASKGLHGPAGWTMVREMTATLAQVTRLQMPFLYRRVPI